MSNLGDQILERLGDDVRSGAFLELLEKLDEKPSVSDVGSSRTYRFERNGLILISYDGIFRDASFLIDTPTYRRQSSDAKIFYLPFGLTVADNRDSVRMRMGKAPMRDPIDNYDTYDFQEISISFYFDSVTERLKLIGAVYMSNEVNTKPYPVIADDVLFSALTEPALRAMQLACEEANRFNSSIVGTECLLLGLLAQDSDTSSLILKSVGVSISELRSHIGTILNFSDRAAGGRVGFSPKIRAILVSAFQSKKTSGSRQIGTIHLLKSLIFDGDSMAVALLARMNIDIAELRRQLLKHSG